MKQVILEPFHTLSQMVKLAGSICGQAKKLTPVPDLLVSSSFLPWQQHPNEEHGGSVVEC